MSSRKLEIEIVGDSSSLSRAFKGAVRDSDTLGSRVRHGAGIAAAALGGGLVAAAGAAAYGIKESAEAAEEANKVHDQTAAVLKSTGHAANVSQKDVEDLAGAISRKTGIDDEQVQSGSNLLLTFTNIRDEVGKGNDIFSQATKAVVDMSAALDQDAKSSAIQLGKALNDPIKGITALQRVGVSFSEQKAEQIKQWVEEGETLRAQKAILRELTTEFGGSAEAQATALDKVKVSLGNVEESFGNVFLPVIEEAATNLNRDLVPELQHTADGLARIAARKDIDLGEKLKLSGDVISREWGDVPGQIGHLIDEATPVVAEHAGKMGVAWAKGMLHGFIDANPLGKAAILLFASKAFGGPAALLGAGRFLGSRLGTSAATEATSTLSAGLGGAATGGLVAKASKSGLASKLGEGLGKGILAVAGGVVATEIAVEGLGAFGVGDPTEGQGLVASLTHGFNTSGVAEAERRFLAERKQMLQFERTLRQGFQGLEDGRFSRLVDIRQVMQRDAQAIAESTQRGSQEARDAMARNYRAGVKAIEVGMDRGVIKTKEGMAQIRQLTRDATLVSGDDPWGIARGFSHTWEKADGITNRSIDTITRDLGKMPKASAQITGQMMLEMARQMRSKGQLSKAEVEKLRSAVVTKLDAMASQGGRKGAAFAANLGGSFGVLDQDVAESLEHIGANVGEILEKLGANNPLMGFTLQYGRQRGAGGSGKKYLPQVTPLPGQAGGGVFQVPGQGLADSVPVAVNGALSAIVAPGETLATFNRHQLPMVNEALAYRWGVNGLGDFFDTYDRPHWMARGGIAEPRIVGPDPLRAGAQAGIHLAAAAGEAYVDRHRPKVTSGVGGYTGPPANMELLGNNDWVDSHTLAVTAYLDKKFGLTMSSGYRSPAHNAAIGGAPGSLHTHGSPSNPGATDSVGSMGGMQSYIAFARQHVAGLQEAMVDNYAGLGYNAHLGFFADGGIVIDHPGWETAFHRWEKGVWNSARHLYGESGPVPSSFIAKGLVGQDGLAGEAFKRARTIYLAPGYARSAMNGGVYGDGVLLHEWAHLFQDDGLRHWEVEGGATAFQRYASPLVFGNGPGPYPSGGYRGYANRVQNEKGSEWLRHGQFQNFTSGGIVSTVGQILLNNGFDYKAAAGILGNAYRESLWDPGAVGTGGGGLWGFTTSPISLADLQAYAESKGKSWEDPVVQTHFMLGHLSGDLKDRLNALDSVPDTTQLFMEEWERPGVPALGDRIAGGRKALEILLKTGKSAGAGGPKKYHPHPGRTGKGGGTEGPGGKYPKGSAHPHGESVPGRPASPLPAAASALSESIQRMLQAPGLGYKDRVAISEIAQQQAEATEDQGDDRAVYAFQEELFKRNKHRLQKRIEELKKKLSARHTAQQDKQWRSQLSQAITELGSTEGSLAGVRSSVHDFNEEEAEGANKAAEEQQRAAEELKASIDALHDEIAKQNSLAKEEMAIGLAEAKRAMADMIAGELGPRVNRGGLAVSTGSVGSS